MTRLSTRLFLSEEPKPSEMMIVRLAGSGRGCFEPVGLRHCPLSQHAASRIPTLAELVAVHQPLIDEIVNARHDIGQHVIEVVADHVVGEGTTVCSQMIL